MDNTLDSENLYCLHERVLASMSTNNISSHQCFEGAPNQNFDVKIVYDLTTKNAKKVLSLLLYIIRHFKA